MRLAYMLVVLTGSLSSLCAAEEKVPPAVQRVLKQIPRIKQGDTLGSFLSAAKIKEKAICIDGVGGHKSHFLTWTIDDSGHWLMWTNSRQVPKEGGDPADSKPSDRRYRGELVSVAVYFRSNVNESLDFERHQRRFPYLSGHTLHSEPKAEQAGAGQPATQSRQAKE